MPDHIQSRTDDMHQGQSKSRLFGLSTVLIIVSLIAVVTAILFLT